MLVESPHSKDFNIFPYISLVAPVKSTPRSFPSRPIPGFLNPMSPAPFVDFADNPKNASLENFNKISVGFFLESTSVSTAFESIPGLAVHQTRFTFPSKPFDEAHFKDSSA